MSGRVSREVLPDDAREACGWEEKLSQRRKRLPMTPVARLLRARFGGLKIMADQLGMSRTHLSEVLLNRPGRGGVMRKKVASVMRAEELAAAGWNADGTLIAKRPPMTSAQVRRRIRERVKS